jgi:PAS domain S-box-containing protein
MTMNNSGTRRNQSISLRRRAEEFLLKIPSSIRIVPAKDTKDLIQELQIHQVELEMQNEELRLAQLELEAARDKYTDLYDFAPVGYFTVSEKGIILDANLTLCTMLGTERGLMIGKPFFIYISPDDQDIFYHQRQKLIETKDKQICELRILKEGKFQFPAQMECIPIFNNDGNLDQIRIALTDITLRKQAEEELQESTEKIKLFAYSVSHDLKNPAISIHGLTRRLSKIYRNLLDEKGRKYCDQILEASEQIARLVQDVNVYIATKEAPINIEEVSLRGLFQTVRDENASQLRIRKIKWSQPAYLPQINADRLVLVRAIRNLVENALKYGGDDLTEINIGYNESDDFHVLSVMDDGIGLKADDSKDIFDIFKRTKASRGIEGAGLGLAIVKEIAERHAGKIWIRQGTKKGIEFRVSISKHLQLSH